MNRKEFLKGTSLAGIGMALPFKGGTASNKMAMATNDCVLIPTETAGPFPLDLTENTEFFRQDITESQEGVPLRVRLKILGENNCGPMPNVRVNIWHCSKDGLYSGYNGNNNPGQQGLTYLRGYQFTDVNGEVEFDTIFPGWYNGRICHIHFQVYVSSSYAAISQLTFPIDTKNALYLDNPSLYSKGADPLSFAQDNIFSDGHEYQVATLEEDSSNGGYQSYLEVTVRGDGTTGVGNIEKEMLKVFEMGQNFPNPYSESTTIPVHLKEASMVKLELWDLSGKRVAEVFHKKLESGKYEFDVDPSRWSLKRKNYVYQLEVKNDSGIFRKPMLMTCLK